VLIALLMVSNTVRVLGLVLLTKDVEASELRDADGSEVGQLRAAGADLAVLLAESDVEEIGSGGGAGQRGRCCCGRCSGGRSG
jgi:hypothetical protein